MTQKRVTSNNIIVFVADIVHTLKSLQKLIFQSQRSSTISQLINK
uniref:Uncharacterized protein n=1 Tax=viral metagenome TaxID=1070528 RepID=A0A6C0C909_9ZZZZ